MYSPTAFADESVPESASRRLVNSCSPGPVVAAIGEAEFAGRSRQGVDERDDSPLTILENESGTNRTPRSAWEWRNASASSIAAKDDNGTERTTRSPGDCRIVSVSSIAAEDDKGTERTTRSPGDCRNVSVSSIAAEDDNATERTTRSPGDCRNVSASLIDHRRRR